MQNTISRTKGMAIFGLLVILGLFSAVSSIRIGAFNIQKFGEAKLGNTIIGGTIQVRRVLFDVRITLSMHIAYQYSLQIIKRYDIVLIQEIQMLDDLFKTFVRNLNIHVTGNAKYACMITLV